MEPDPNDNLIKKMLTSKTGAESCCYYSPHPDGEHLLYKWTAYGDSKNVRTYACAGCRSVKNKDNSKPYPPKSKRDEEAQTWIISPLELNQAHYCTPLEMSKEIGKQITYARKKDIIKNGGSVKAQIRKAETVITEKFGNKPENVRMSIEHHAVGRKATVSQQLRRAKKRRYPEINDIEDIDNPAKKEKLHQWTLTISGHLNGTNEKLIRYYDAKMVILMSDIQIQWFKSAAETFNDGTFGYAPAGFKQIYRIFGLFKKTQCSPLATILLKKKDEETYREAFSKIREIVGIPLEDYKWKVAHFDQEIGAVNAFKTVFGEIRRLKFKVCSFHAKKSIISDIGSLHVKTTYNNHRSFKKFVQRLGGIQLINPEYLDIAKIYLLEEADALGNDETLPAEIVGIARKLVEDYYKNWVDASLGREFFSLYDIKRNRTQNYAETYHGKQKDTFGEKHLPLGTWIFYQREAQHGDDNKLNRVMKRYDDPPAANEDTQEADFKIDEAKNRMDIFMEDDESEQKEMFLYYSLKLGKLLGFRKTL